MAECQQIRERRQRTFRARRDPLIDYSDAELIERYRLDSAGIRYVTDLLRDSLQSDTKRNKALTQATQRLVALTHPQVYTQFVTLGKAAFIPSLMVSHAAFLSFAVRLGLNFPFIIFNFPSTHVHKYIVSLETQLGFWLLPFHGVLLTLRSI